MSNVAVLLFAALLVKRTPFHNSKVGEMVSKQSYKRVNNKFILIRQLETQHLDGANVALFWLKL